MRVRALLPTLALVPGLVLLACAKAEDRPSDTAAAVAAPAAPARLSAGDLSGTWEGATMPLDRDTVLVRWTTVSVNDSTSNLVFAGRKDSVRYTMRFDADSMIATSVPYVRPTAPKGAKGPKVVFHSVGRLRDGKLVGTVRHTLAAKPDSVVDNARWEATRAQ